MNGGGLPSSRAKFFAIFFQFFSSGAVPKCQSEKSWPLVQNSRQGLASAPEAKQKSKALLSGTGCKKILAPRRRFSAPNERKRRRKGREKERKKKERRGEKKERRGEKKERRGEKEKRGEKENKTREEAPLRGLFFFILKI